ncbi:MAG: hypothetical protein ACJASF_001934, partial [Vicingaceae bacterium]
TSLFSESTTQSILSPDFNTMECCAETEENRPKKNKEYKVFIFFFKFRVLQDQKHKESMLFSTVKF